MASLVNDKDNNVLVAGINLASLPSGLVIPTSQLVKLAGAGSSDSNDSSSAIVLKYEQEKNWSALHATAFEYNLNSSSSTSSKRYVRLTPFTLSTTSASKNNNNNTSTIAAQQQQLFFTKLAKLQYVFLKSIPLTAIFLTNFKIV